MTPDGRLLYNLARAQGLMVAMLPWEVLSIATREAWQRVADGMRAAWVDQLQARLDKAAEGQPS